MPPDRRFADDAVLGRVARARRPMPDELSPGGERATGIADRVLATPRHIPPRRTGRVRMRPRSAGRRWHARRRALLGTGGLALAAACAAIALLVSGTFSGSSPSRALADVIHLEVRASPLASSELRAFDSTRLGRTIQRQLRSTQENVQTGTAAENRTAIALLLGNRRACAQAGLAVAAVPVPARGLLHVVQRDWVRGIRLQELGNEQLVASLRAFDAGHRALGKREMQAALPTITADDELTGWAEEALYAPPPGPRPHLPPLSPSAERILR